MVASTLAMCRDQTAKEIDAGGLKVSAQPTGLRAVSALIAGIMIGDLVWRWGRAGSRRQAQVHEIQVCGARLPTALDNHHRLPTRESAPHGVREVANIFVS